MTLFWIFAAVLTIGVVAMLVPPLLRPRTLDASRADFDMEVYRDQLAELEREMQRGLIGAEQAEAARAEIGRRMLATADTAAAGTARSAQAKGAAGKSAKTDSARTDSARTDSGSDATITRGLAVALAVVIPVGALLVYLPLGRPDLPAMPLASRTPAATQPPAAVVDAVGKMQEYLKQNPQDKKAWMMLGQVYGRMDRLDDSVDALRKAHALDSQDPEIAGTFAEAVTMANRGIVPEEGITAFETVLKSDPKDPRARFYLAQARSQAGDFQGALDRLVALAAESPADAPWLPMVREQVAGIAGRLNLDVAQVMPKPLPPAGAQGGAPALSQEALAAARNMAPEQQQEMIRGMVDKLAARLKDNPTDVEGWLRLAQSYDVLGETDKADEAVRKAREQAPKRVDVLLAHADRILAQVPENSTPGPLPPAFIEIIKEVQSIQPDNQDALWFLGLEASNTGKPDEAAELWGRLLAKLDPKSEDYASLQARIQGLKR